MSGARRLAALALAFVATLVLIASTAAADPSASTSDQAINQLFLVVEIGAIGVGVFVGVILMYTVLKFRKRKGHTEPLPIAADGSGKSYHKLEAAWTIIPAIILLIIGALAFQTLAFTDTVPQHYDVTLTVIAHQWFWEFYANYTNGTSVHSVGAVTLPVNATVRLYTASVDVAHSLFIPALGVHVDAVPGHVNELWFKPTSPGKYDIECTQFCGVNHYAMVATLVVTPS